MTELRLLSYTPQQSQYVKGLAVIDVQGKYSVVVKVVKSKNGHHFCSFTSSKCGESWIPNFSFDDQGYQKIFLTNCLELVQPYIASSREFCAPIVQPPQVNEDPSPTNEDDTLPF